MRIKRWHTGLLGFIGGPIVGFLMFLVLVYSEELGYLSRGFSDKLLLYITYPAYLAAGFLGRYFYPNNDMAGLFFLLPMTCLYASLIGVIIAFTARYYMQIKRR